MTDLLAACIIFVFIFQIYVSVRMARQEQGAAEFLDAGQALPAWIILFILPGFAFSAIGLERHLTLVSIYGLQASHLALGLVTFSIVSLIMFNRVWYITQVAGFRTPGESFGEIFKTTSLRIIILVILVLFSVPFSANLLSFTGELIEKSTQLEMPRVNTIWFIAFGLAISSIIGGWRGTILGLSLLVSFVLFALPGTAILSNMISPFSEFTLLSRDISDAILKEKLPGVIQYSSGIGKEEPYLGIFSAAAIFSSGFALMGLVFSPQMFYLFQTSSETKQMLSISSVWIIAGVLTGTLICFSPLLAQKLVDGPTFLASFLYKIEPISGVTLVLIYILASIFTVQLLVTGGAVIFTKDFIVSYLLPNLSPKGQRFAGRIVIASFYFFLASFASFLPLISAIIGSTIPSLSVQMLPAFLGLTFYPWISLGAALAGMIIGMLIVVFTEPLGIILFEALFVDLPWGRWPLTIHSAAWGLAVNALVVLLASSVTINRTKTSDRDRLHEAVNKASLLNKGNEPLIWYSTIVWAFLAYGPGAVLGNTFFSDPLFTSLTSANLGIPSLLAWQILFWLLGVFVVWCFAEKIGFGHLSKNNINPIKLERFHKAESPVWLANAISRVITK